MPMNATMHMHILPASSEMCVFCLAYFPHSNVNDKIYNDELILKLDYNLKCDLISFCWTFNLDDYK